MIELIEQNRPKLLELCRKYGVRRLDLFGSAAEGTFDPSSSDLDFLVEFENMTFENSVDRYFGLHNDLEDLFGRRIDLVSANAVRNPYFREVLEQTRVPLYAA